MFYGNELLPCILKADSIQFHGLLANTLASLQELRKYISDSSG